MAWCCVDQHDQVQSVCLQRHDDIASGWHWIEITDARYQDIMHGAVALRRALDSDDSAKQPMDLEMRWPHRGPQLPAASIKYLQHCTVLGTHADANFYARLLAEIPDHLLQQVHLVFWDWRYQLPGPVHAGFDYGQWDDIFQRNQDKRVVFVIDSHWEAPNYQMHLAHLCEQLISRGHVMHHHILHLSNGTQAAVPIWHVDTTYAMCIGFGGSVVPMDHSTHAFIMLCRQPRPLRVMGMVELLRRDLLSYGFASCGNTESHNDRSWITQWVPPHMQERFPLDFDGVMPQGAGKQFMVSDERIRGAVINVIAETSQDPCLVGERWDWVDAMLTEKSTKAFRLAQLPLWLSAPGTVALARRYGFDVFDDVIDHAYDEQLVPERRVQMVMDQLQTLCEMGLQQLNHLRAGLQPRLQANRQLVNHIAETVELHMAEKIRERLQYLLDDSGTVPVPTPVPIYLATN
jgi:hypothetical protein